MTRQQALANTGIVLTLATLVLFVTQTLFLAPLALLSVLGCVYIIRTWPEARGPVTMKLLALFLCLWLPMAFSTLDAINGSRALEKTLAYALYLPAAVFIVYSTANARAIQVLHAFIFILVSIWIIDGTIQYFAGKNLFGYPYTPPQLMGMFYPKARMPYLLAVLAPLYFEFIRLHCKKHIWLLLLLIPFAMMILLGGKRTAWMMLMFSGAGYLVYLYLINRRFNLKMITLTTIIVLIPAWLLVATHHPLSNRIDSTLAIFSTDAATIDKATAHRLDLWRVAVAIARDHWINGVGPRGYREVFNSYAEQNNFWVQSGRPQGTTHPHLALAEIACETGLVGLAGYLVFYLLLLRWLYHELRAGRLQHMPWLLCPLTAWFPLNAHLAFYGSYWSSFGWWMLAVSFAVVYSARHGPDTDH